MTTIAGPWLSWLAGSIRDHFAETKDRISGSIKYLGIHFVLSVVAIEHVLQGFIYGGGTGGIIGIPILFLFRSFGTLTASRLQVLRTIAVSPWALKPIFGIVSDLLHVDGFGKLPYIGATIVSAIMSCFVIVFTWPLSPNAATILFFLLFLQIAVADLLLEAQYTDKVRDEPEVNHDLTSFVSVGVGVGQLASLVLCGILINYLPLQYMYLLPVLPFVLTLCYPIARNWIDDREYDRRVDAPRLNLCCGRLLWYTNRDDPTGPDIPVFGLDAGKIREKWRVFLMGLIIVAISLITNVMGLLDIPIVYLLVFSLLATPALIAGFFLLIDRRIAMIQTFIIVQNLCTVPLEGALFFFFTDNAASYPAGPHFSDTFYITGIGVTAAVINVLSIVLYNLCMSKWKLRSILLAANFVYLIVTLPNIALFLRWNRDWGIPDWIFVLGTEAMQVIVNVWCTLPLAIIMNQLCPKGVAATSYALLAGSNNLGNALSQYLGAFVLHAMNINPTGAPNEGHQFDQLWKAGIISAALPVLPIALIFVLIPNTSASESILDEDVVAVAETTEDASGESVESDSFDTVSLASLEETII
jgi:hypothetical protein